VLIPRPETESVVEAVVDRCANAGLGSPRILDVGTGSGCIAVALLRQVPEATSVATDVSPAALAVARTNAERHGVADRLTLVEADRLALPGEVVPDGGFDVLVCNPPYVAVGEMAGLDASVRDFEPRAALTDGGDGLSFYEAIGDGAAALLSPNGAVVVEVADGQSGAARQAVERSGRLAHAATIKDRVTGNDRVMVFAVR
jgi:release factor glutamine methyltransferase